MKNKVYQKLLDVIKNELGSFDTLISADNVLGLNVTSEDVINFLEFSNTDKVLSAPIIGNILITEGDVLSVLKIINDLQYNTGEYILYINNDNVGTNTYLVNRANKIYQELGIELVIKIDYSDTYNAYFDSLVSIVGSNIFNSECENDFSNANHVIV